MNTNTELITQELLNSRLPYETDSQKAMLLSIGKKVYTKIRKSNSIPFDVSKEFGDAIRNRDYNFLSFSCSKPMLRMIAPAL